MLFLSKLIIRIVKNSKLKERVGFEPTERVNVHLISNQTQSTISAISPIDFVNILY